MRHLQPVYGTNYALSCGHPMAAAAAADILSSGENIVDAALASAATLAVVLPQACSLGGDAFILIHEAKTKRTLGLNTSGRSPAFTDATAFGDAIPERGPLTFTVPGVAGGWQALHQRFGRLPWARILRQSDRSSGARVSDLARPCRCNRHLSQPA